MGWGHSFSFWNRLSGYQSRGLSLTLPRLLELWRTHQPQSRNRPPLVRGCHWMKIRHQPHTMWLRWLQRAFCAPMELEDEGEGGPPSPPRGPPRPKPNTIWQPGHAHCPPHPQSSTASKVLTFIGARSPKPNPHPRFGLRPAAPGNLIPAVAAVAARSSRFHFVAGADLSFPTLVSVACRQPSHPIQPPPPPIHRPSPPRSQKKHPSCMAHWRLPLAFR